jgi:hypothetical protein
MASELLTGYTVAGSPLKKPEEQNNFICAAKHDGLKDQGILF